MGWRAIRIGLDRPAMLRQQLRALLRAAGGRDLYRQVSDDRRDRRVRGGARACSTGKWRAPPPKGTSAPRSVKLGVMLEVPSLLWQLPALLERVDFLSIGTNDLAQFLFACDRGNPRLAERYDLLSAPMLALFRQVIAQCRAAETPLSMCGEMAGNPIEAMVLIGLGFRTLSLAADRARPGQDDDPQPRCRRRWRAISTRSATAPTIRCGAGSKPMPATMPSCCE